MVGETFLGDESRRYKVPGPSERDRRGESPRLIVRQFTPSEQGVRVDGKSLLRTTGMGFTSVLNSSVKLSIGTVLSEGNL